MIYSTDARRCRADDGIVERQDMTIEKVDGVFKLFIGKT
jgi:hypothetical protein